MMFTLISWPRAASVGAARADRHAGRARRLALALDVSGRSATSPALVEIGAGVGFAWRSVSFAAALFLTSRWLKEVDAGCAPCSP